MDQQNILSLNLNGIELTKNQLNENQLSNQVSYLEQSQNQEGFSNILKGFKDTSISVISEQTLQKRVRSQIVRRRNVNQTRIFQNAMCQIINQSEDQHAIISYQDQDNNNSIQHISSRRSNNQIVQQYDQKSFCLGSNGSQNSFGSQEGQAKQKQITKEDITDNQIKCQQLLKLKEDSFTNKQQGEQQHEKEQSLKHEKISCQVNIDQQQNIQGGQISSQNDSNKKEDYIKEQENIQDSNNQVNNLQLKNEKAYTIQQNDQQKDSNKLSLNQEYTNAQENAQQLENKKSLMCDKNYQNNDLSKIEAQIEQKQTTQQTISNNQINSTQTIEFQFEEKCNENLLKDAQKHNKENSLNQEQAVNQKNANEQLKSNLKQQNISDQDIQISNDRNNPIQQNTPTIQREIQSIENEEQSKTNKNIQELNNLIKRYSSQLEKMFKEIMDYNFSEFEESGELDQIGCLVKKKWNQQTFEKVEGNQVQSEIFQSQKSKIFESLQQQQYYLCKILISNQMQDFILGFFQDNNHIDDEYIFQITYNSVQSDIDSQKLILQILGFEYDYVKLEQENISVLIIKKDDFLSIQDKFEQLVQFESNIQQIQNFYEINSSDCQECKSCENQEICEDQTCFKNIKSRILSFLKNNEYFYCEYSNKKVSGIVFQLNQEQFKQEYLKCLYKTIFNFQENIQTGKQNTFKQQPISFYEYIQQQKQNISQEENVKQIRNIDLVNEYSFQEYQVLEKSDQNQDKNNLNPKYQRKWDLKIFNDLNNNKVSNTFLKLQNQIIQILKSKNYFLCNCFVSNQQEDIFLGYYQENGQKYFDYTFVILYNPLNSEISKYYNLAKQLNQELNHFTINGFTHVLILLKDTFLQIYNNHEQVCNTKIQQSKDAFEIINKDKVINLQKCGVCKNCKNKQECEEYRHFRNFQQSKNFIFEKLIEKNYYICEYLNKGGEGLIFYGYQFIKEKQDVVFKILFDSDQEQIENEIYIMKMFDCHLNVIKFIDYIQINDNIYTLVLEKCKFSLKEELELLQKNKQFPLNKLLQMIFNLLDGLVQFRIYNILHLDIKPQNILLTNSDQYVYTDFGISSLKKNNKQVDIKGCTPFYASPEQKNNDQNIDYLSDVYSLGKTFKIIMETFKNVQDQQYQKITDNLMKIVNEKMIESELKSRFNCLELRNEFFKYILEQNESIEFLNHYIKQIKQILYSYPYDKNKEIPYFLKIFLTYKQNILDYWKQFIQYKIESDSKQIQQNISLSLGDVGYCYQNLGDNKKALEYNLESLQMLQQIFKENHPDIASSLNNVGSCYVNLGDNKKALEYNLESLQMFQQIFKENHPYIASSLNNVGACFQNLGDNKKALEYNLESLQMRKQIFKENHPDIASSLNNVGSCYVNLGDNKKALEYNLESLQMFQQIFKENHPYIATSLNNVGACFQNLGDNKKALEYNLESLQMRKQIFKENHPDIASSLNNVGSCYVNLGDNKKALEYNLESLQMRKQIFKENHPDIASSLNNVGACFQNLGDNKKALEYKLESLQMIKQIFKENHPSIASSLNNIGICYEKLGDYKKAQEYQLESLQIFQQIFKENHPDIASSLINIGLCYKNLGDNQKGLEYLLKSLQMLQQIFKENHPHIASSLNNIGNCYANLGDNKKALQYYLESLQMFQQIFKENHPDIASSLNNVGNCYITLGDNKKALEYLLESLEMTKQIFKENHPDIASSLNNVGICYENLGDNKKGLEYQLESLEMTKQIFKENHPVIASSLNNISICYENLGDNKYALEYQLESLQMRKQIFKENHPDIAISLNNVGSCYRNLGDHKKALEYRLENLQMRKQIFKENHPDIADQLDNVANCYINLGDMKKALEYLLESLKMRKQIFKENHPDIADSLSNVGICYKILGDNKKALEYLLESLEMRKQMCEKNQFRFVGLLFVISNCYLFLLDKEIFQEYNQEFIEILPLLPSQPMSVILNSFFNNKVQGYQQ